MAQAISVYISKAIFGLVMILNLEQLKYVTDTNSLYDVNGINYYNLNIWCQSFVLQYSGEPVIYLWY